MLIHKGPSRYQRFEKLFRVQQIAMRETKKQEWKADGRKLDVKKREMDM
jgi:hypothetical protein